MYSRTDSSSHISNFDWNHNLEKLNIHNKHIYKINSIQHVEVQCYKRLLSALCEYNCKDIRLIKFLVTFLSNLGLQDPKNSVRYIQRNGNVSYELDPNCVNYKCKCSDLRVVLMACLRLPQSIYTFDLSIIINYITYVCTRVCEFR